MYFIVLLYIIRIYSILFLPQYIFRLYWVTQLSIIIYACTKYVSTYSNQRYLTTLISVLRSQRLPSVAAIYVYMYVISWVVPRALREGGKQKVKHIYYTFVGTTYKFHFLGIIPSVEKRSIVSKVSVEDSCVGVVTVQCSPSVVDPNKEPNHRDTSPWPDNGQPYPGIWPRRGYGDLGRTWRRFVRRGVRLLWQWLRGGGVLPSDS